MVGESRGTVTRRNLCHALAPSTCAASRRSSGMACNPADIRMKLSPRFCQIVVTATATSAHDGLFKNGGSGWMDLSRPTCGLSRVPKITDATATEVATVDEKIVR